MLYRQIEKLDLPGMRVDKDAINLAFTKSTGDDVLSIVGDKLPANMKNGQQIFGYIQNRLTKYYDDALDKIGPVRPDDEFTAGITQARNALVENLGDKNPAVKGFQNFINANVMKRIDDTGAIAPQDMKRLEEIFKTKIDSIKAVDTPGETTKAAYDDAYKALKGLLIRNDTEGDIAKANLAYMQRSRIMEATQKNAAEIGAAGTYSPAEMAKVAAKQGGSIESALGTAPLQAEATKALNVVGDTTQEAQKFRTLMIAGKLTGLGALGLFSPAIALPLLTASGMAYKTAQKLMDEPGKLRLAVQSALKDNPVLAGQVAGNLYNQNKTPTQATPVPVQEPQKAANSTSVGLSANYPALISAQVGSAGRFDPQHPSAQKVRQEAERQGLGEFADLFVRQAYQESKFDPKAKSSANARGIMQIVPGTARDLGLKDPYNPDDNIRAGVEYMGQLLKRYDYDVKKALAAYNGGMRRIDKTGLNTLKPETQKYLKNILGE
jgi:soluble lytic murein transglycosylase-like protein